MPDIFEVLDVFMMTPKVAQLKLTTLNAHLYHFAPSPFGTVTIQNLTSRFLLGSFGASVESNLSTNINSAGITKIQGNLTQVRAGAGLVLTSQGVIAMGASTTLSIGSTGEWHGPASPIPPVIPPVILLPPAT